MGRPKVPLIDRKDAIATALSMIDRDGLDAFSLRRLAAELGVNAASLYHHFEDKRAILDGVRIHIAFTSDLAAPERDGATWQERVRGAANTYRRLLLLHPNVAPLMHPNAFERPYGLVLRERIAAKVLEAGVPDDLVFPMIESVEFLAYASALLNPAQEPAATRLALTSDDGAPALARVVEAAPATAQAIFDVQLDAVIAGWTEQVRGRGRVL